MKRRSLQVVSALALGSVLGLLGCGPGMSMPDRANPPTDGSSMEASMSMEDAGDSAPPEDVATTCTPGQARGCYEGPASTAGVGACQGGTEACDSSGEWSGVCSGQVLPSRTERCGNNVDDNCNGTVDEGCCPSQTLGSRVGNGLARGDARGLGDATSGSCGGMGGPELSFSWTAPSAGRFTFDTAGSSYDTTLYLRSGTCGGAELACNDDRVSGDPVSSISVDLMAGQSIVIFLDAFGPSNVGQYVLNINAATRDCMSGQTRSCYSGLAGTQMVGICRAGMQSCDATGSWSTTCTGEVVPQAMERCGNNMDDNCNGTVDEGCEACSAGSVQSCYSGPMSTQGVGACRPGTRTCDAMGMWSAMCTGEVLPSMTETCGNRVDDDCDGMTDEGCGTCMPGMTRSCYTGPSATMAVGACRAGTQTCDATGNFATACIGEQTPAAMERCDNGIDDDCDGMTDEGCGMCMPGATQSCYSGAPATMGVGRCRGGTRTCGATRMWGMCAGEVVPAASEVCGNGMDDDCNGMTDENCRTPGALLAVGSGHACTVRADRTVVCWGQNDYGQLGNGTTGDRATAVPVTGLTEVAEVAAGEVHSCAGRLDGTVWCWGYGAYGQLGDGGQTARSAPVRVSGLTGTTQVVAGKYHSCALRVDGSVWCWGRNLSGEIGDGSMMERATPVRVPGVSSIRRLVGGQENTCAIAMNGTVYCWGDNINGVLGNGNSTDSPTPVVNTAAMGAVDLALGWLHGCARLSTGGVRCWGSTALGDGSSLSSLTGVMVTGVSTASGITATNLGSCALLMNGTVTCWGSNQYGEVGDGTNASSRPLPALVSGLSGAVEVRAGTGHFVCARLMDGSVRCWGDSAHGETGDGTLPTQPMPVQTMGVTGAVDVELGHSVSCAARTDRSVWCWGNDPSRLPTGALWSFEGTAAQSAGLDAGGRLFVQSARVCARSGATGISCANATSTPTILSGGNATEVGFGSSHQCFLQSGGTVQCSGSNTRGQLGDGTTMTRTGLVTVVGVTGATQIAVSQSSSCALVAGGAVRCWGGNVSGQLGDNSTTDRPTPVAVSGLTGASAIAAGDSYMCALVGGGVRCWGSNTFGTLGNGTTTRSLVPVSVTGVSSAVQLSAGNNHNCVRLMDGSIQCWGSNYQGQLGVTGITSRSTPGAVPGVGMVRDVDAGGTHTCAVMSDNTVRCWGYNFNGQLGTGYIGIRRTPVAVMLP